MRTEEAGLTHARADFRPVRGARRVNLRPERAYMRLGMANSRPGSLNSRLGRANLRLGIADLRPERINFEAWEGQFEA